MVVEVRSVPKWARDVTLHGSGRQLTQHLELLCHKLHSLEAHAGSVAARPVKAGDETHCDRVAADSEDDRNGRGRGFGRERRCYGVAITATRRRIRSAAKSGSRSS